MIHPQLSLTMAPTLQSFWLTSLLFVLLASLQQTTSRIFDNQEQLPIKQMHEQWMAQYGRVYKDTEEKGARFKIFKENVEHIQSFNNAGNKSYKLGINAFTDMTNAELRASRNRLRPSNSLQATSFKYENVSDVPSSMDWRKKGAVTPIKDQAQCGKY